MGKSDRVALVISVAYIIFLVQFGGIKMWDNIWLFLTPVFLYWGYRFIKGG